MGRDGKYVVAYDLRDDSEREKVARILQGFGSRVQKSVFECRLSVGMRARLAARLQALELASGGVLVYRLNDRSRAIAIGDCPGYADEEPFAHVL